MDRSEAKREIRSRIDCRDYLQKSKGGLYCCPYCGSGTGPNQTGALKVYDSNTWTCHACSRSGDVIDLYQQTTGKDFNTAIAELADIAGITISGDKFNSRGGTQGDLNGRKNIKTYPDVKTQQEASRTPTEASADYTAYYAKCAELLKSPEGEAARKYLAERKVLGPAMEYGAGFDPEADPANAPGAMDGKKAHPCPRVIIPCSKDYYIARRIDGETSYKAPNPKGSRPALFNGDLLYDPEAQEIFITEGIFDALAIVYAGGQAIAINGAPHANLLIERLEQEPTKATLILCPDNDPAGMKAARELQEGLQRLKIPFITADIAEGYKDANEAAVNDYLAFYDRVQATIEEAKAYREQLQRQAQQAAHERQQRTGESMIDAFLQAVKSEKYKPIPTGVTDIDRALYGGFTRQTLILLGAAPGAGKTALAQWIFEGMAERGTSCLYLNLEMSRDQILARSIARIAARHGDKITPAEVKQGYRWTAEQEEAVAAAAEEYRKTIAPRMIYNPDGITTDLDIILEYMESEAARAEDAGMPAPLTIIDYLQIITGREREDEVATIKRAVASFKRFAMQHNTVVFCIMAHNRATNQSGTVTQESGRDTSALEYSADLQLGLAFTRCLNRPGYDKKSKEDLTPEDMKYITLKVTKGRDTKLGAEVDLYFNGETMTYMQLDPVHPEEQQTQKRVMLRI